MSDERRLAERVGKLASPYRTPSGPRELPTGAHGDPLPAVLREIDETMLPRLLDFRRGGNSLCVSAGNRRLLTIERVDGAGQDTARLVKLGVPLTQPDPDALAALRRLLTGALAGEGRLTVSTESVSNTGGNLASGVTAASLAASWNIDLFGGGETEGGARSGAIDRYFATAPTFALAWIRLASGSVNDEGGDGKYSSRLKDFADSADMADLDLHPRHGNRIFIAIGRAPDEGDCLVYVADKHDTALLLIRAKVLDQAQAAWKTAIA